MPQGAARRRSMRLTTTTKMVLAVLLDAGTDQELYGLEVGHKTELAPGTVHPILAKLEREGWVASRLEQADPHEIGRRPRRYYRLTGLGASSAAEALQAAPTPALLLQRWKAAET